MDRRPSRDIAVKSSNVSTLNDPYTCDTCVKRPYKTKYSLAFYTGGCLLLHESSAGAFCASFSQQ